MKVFDTEVFKLTLHPNLLKEVKAHKHHALRAKDVWESRDQSLSYRPDARFFVLLEGEENASVTPDARRAAASVEYSKNVAALALCSDKTHEAIMGNLFLKVNKPKVPTRFFDKRDKVLIWLKSQM